MAAKEVKFGANARAQIHIVFDNTMMPNMVTTP